MVLFENNTGQAVTLVVGINDSVLVYLHLDPLKEGIPALLGLGGAESRLLLGGPGDYALHG